MKSTIAILSLAAVAAASPDPQITERAQVGKRQSDPALLGYISESGASSFSDARSCDYPATLSSAGSLAQCCSGSDCVFWSSCSAGTLFAQSTSLRCDQGFCNTAVLAVTPGARSGESYLGCWATSLGQDAFTIVRDVGSAIVTPTASASSGASAASNARSASARSSASGSVASSGTAGTATQPSTGTVQSSGAAVANAAKPLSGAFGLAAMLFGML
ncbi:hypothetical protein BU25DRAFT_409552 [Macroventuria anomochaeta]|uniref:Uncharacterized protein n=1 Tax=Macroventuria anomochaeta TaxID=301207 RepID=A0ACB6S4X2_9PLEO|nr:uncharacterized protein BU25DRAFT_409552 [Macroventuria anomochaeta]KAF2629088.1 hypothetical protein BU25DRAFT_409552 [Macroventuria anomochaeta]